MPLLSYDVLVKLRGLLLAAVVVFPAPAAPVTGFRTLAILELPMSAKKASAGLFDEATLGATPPIAEPSWSWTEL